jgi:spore germination cell wall hydrolase CwlJ-like protein
VHFPLFCKKLSNASAADKVAAIEDRKMSRASGEWPLLQRPIDFDPNELTVEEKIFRGIKRLGAALAVGAVVVSVLDIANVRSVDAVAELLHDGRARIAEFPDHMTDIPERIRSGISSISIAAEAAPSVSTAQVTVAIPRDDALTRPFVLASASTEAAEVPDIHRAVAKLAAARAQDAIEAAMAPPASPAIAPAQLASIEARATPEEAAALQPISRPMASAIPLDTVPLPRAAPGAPPPSPAERLHLEGKEYAKAERCLANAIYFESRSEPVRGQMAVAQVVLNRVFSGFYPKDVCGTVYQNANRYLACQFTFACDGKRKLINERGAWARANRIAKQTLNGQIYLPEVGKSTHYHALYVHPNWVREMRRLARYGIHAFYRPIAWGNGAEEPVWGQTAMAQDKKK